MFTKKQKSILDFINKYTKKHGFAPSYEEIGKHFGLSSPATIHQHIQALKDKGYLSKAKNQRRGIEISEGVKMIQIPLLGTIAAGQPITLFDSSKETIAVPENRIPNSSNVYALRVQGESMIEENINDGDVILVRQQTVAENGQKVVALIDSSEATIKKFYNEGKFIRLQPANRTMSPIVIKKGEKEFSIQGIFLDVIKNESAVPLLIESPKEKRVKFYEKLPINKIILGDALKELKKFPDKSIDIILTDPPYGLNKTGIKNDSDLSIFYSSLSDSYRILKEDAFYITFFSTKFLPKIFVNNPFEYFWNFILYCPNGRVGSPIGYSKYMTCTVFKKGKPKMTRRNKDIFVDTPGRMIEPDEGFIDHPTPKPKTFVSEILKMFSKENDIVLDPFMGSGSTAMACKLTNRKYIGIELDEKYHKLAEKRLKNSKLI